MTLNRLPISFTISFKSKKTGVTISKQSKKRVLVSQKANVIGLINSQNRKLNQYRISKKISGLTTYYMKDPT